MVWLITMLGRMEDELPEEEEEEEEEKVKDEVKEEEEAASFSFADMGEEAAEKTASVADIDGEAGGDID